MYLDVTLHLPCLFSKCYYIANLFGCRKFEALEVS